MGARPPSRSTFATRRLTTAHIVARVPTLTPEGTAEPRSRDGPDAGRRAGSGSRSGQPERPAGLRARRSGGTRPSTPACSSTRARSRRRSLRANRVVFRARIGVGTADRADADGLVLRPQPAHPLPQRVLRPCRVRHERPLDADGLARRRLRRDPRHEPAGAPARARLARLHPHAERRHPRARAPHAGRNAGGDHVMRTVAPRCRRCCCVLLLAAPAARAVRDADRAVVRVPARAEGRADRDDTTRSRRAIGPFLPPSIPRSRRLRASRRGGACGSRLLGLGALRSCSRRVRLRRSLPPVPASSGEARRLRAGARARTRARRPQPKPVRLREQLRAPRRAGAPRRQYAPLPPVAVAEPDVEREPRRSVVRRTGLLRSRFVVVADEPGGEVEPGRALEELLERRAAYASERAAEASGRPRRRAPRRRLGAGLARARSTTCSCGASTRPSGSSPTIEAYTLAPTIPGRADRATIAPSPGAERERADDARRRARGSSRAGSSRRPVELDGRSAEVHRDDDLSPRRQAQAPAGAGSSVVGAGSQSSSLAP